MDAASARWVTVSGSEFAHERAGLDHVRALLPDRAPYRAWSNFEFRDSGGRWHEVDLLVLGEQRLHLVELKHYRGVIGGNAYRWQRNGRSEDSPLLLARRKAQRLKAVIVRALDEMERGLGRHAAPFVQECIFLHAPGGVCELPPGQRTDLFGLDGAAKSGLPSIAARLLEPPDPSRGTPRLIEKDLLAVKLFEKIGFALRREREVGTWRLIGPAASDGDGWQDWPAEHRVARADRVTIRFFVSPAGASQSDRAAEQRLVEREYDLTHRLKHEGLLAPRDVVDDELGAGLVFDRDTGARRLDLWLADQTRPQTLTDQLGLIRQLAEALDYAHRSHVVHRGLSPEAIWISGEPPVAKIGDWQRSGRDAESGTARTGTGRAEMGSATRLFRDLAPSSDARERQADAYLAPEGRWSAGIDRIRVDLFGLGAVGYLILSGRPPAEHAADLGDRLRRDNGLDLAADLPEVGPRLRELILRATRPTVSDRFDSVAAFLQALDEAEHDAVVVTSEPGGDPLDAVRGARLDDRFTLRSRLGSGSTAVGLLVEDASAPGEDRVLKVARDDAAVARLQAEAAVLHALPADPHLVRPIEPEPLTVGTRRALLLESAGGDTLATALRARPRLSLDLLQRWGTDVLRALIALDRAGVDHRDIKPANLGVRIRRGDRSKHLVLFDFSLARAGAADVDAGTPPYLDPFLGQGTRSRWDSAAERYAASVTLFEMATGRTPQYAADGTAATMTDSEALLDEGDFDPAVAAALAVFFRRALRRDAAARFDTAQDMLTAWTAAFATESTLLRGDADARAAVATLDTPLPQAGLSARALSALEHRAATVADLLGIDAAELTRLRGWSNATRNEVVARAKQWRARFAVSTEAATSTRLSDDLDDAVRLLLSHTASKKAPGRERVIGAILGHSGDRAGDAAAVAAVDAFAPLADIGALLGRSAPMVWQQLTGAIAEMSEHAESRDVLIEALAQIEAVVAAAGGLMLADDVGAALVPGDGDSAVVGARRRTIAGIVRLALDRADQAERLGGDEAPVARRRRRRDSSVLLAGPPALLDVADPLGHRADELVAAALETTEPIVAVSRAAARLREVWPAALTPPDDLTLVRMAASLSGTGAASQRGELHRRGLTPVDAARVALAGLSLTEAVTRADIASRIRSRFPALRDLPGGSALDDVLRLARVELRWDGARYQPPPRPASTTGLVSATWAPPSGPIDRAGEQREDRVLAESREARSFLALGVHPSELEPAAEALRTHAGAAPIDVTTELIAALRAQGELAGIGWDDIEAADAAEPGSRPAEGLRKLIAGAVPDVLARIHDAADAGPVGTWPVLLTDAAPLARYGQLQTLARFTDITAHRRQAVWLLFPLDESDTSAVDGVPIPLAHGGQFLILDRTWIGGAQPAEAAL